MRTASTGAQAVDRAASLLVHVLRSDDAVTFPDLVAATGLPKSTVSRLLGSLERNRLVARTHSGEVVPGDVVTAYARRQDPHDDLAERARPALQRLGAATGETINLAIGTDGGGSTRLPAAYSGVVGLHPTTNLIPWADYEVPQHSPMMMSVGWRRIGMVEEWEHARIAQRNERLRLRMGQPDTGVPAAPVITTPASDITTNDNTPTISGTAEANSTVRVFNGATQIGTASADGSGNWTFTPSSALADGSNTITARAVDAAGNVSGLSNAVGITIDSTPPVTTIGANPPAQSNSASAHFTFTADDPAATFECKLDGGSFAACTSPQSYSGLAQGLHTLTVTATNSAGSASATTTFTVDTIAPTVPTNVTATSITKTSATLNWTAATDANGIGVYNVFSNGNFLGGVLPTSYSMTGLTCATTYWINIMANDPANNATQSASAL